MAPKAKRIRLTTGPQLQDLPPEVLNKIVGFLPLEQQIPFSLMSSRLQSAMPYKNPTGCLNITDLPFKKDLIVHVENNNDWPRRYDFVDAAGITSALEFLLPKFGGELMSLSFESSTRYWEMTAAHMDLIARHCPNLKELKLVRMCYAGRNDFNAGALRRLTKLSSFALSYFSDEVCLEEKLALMDDIADLITNWPLTQLSLVGFVDCWPSISAPNLTRLSLDNCRLDNSQLGHIRSPHLTALSLKFCWKLTGFSFVWHLRNLTELELVKVKLGEGVVEYIARNNPNINRLTLEEVEVDKFNWLRHLGQLKFFSLKCDWDRRQISHIPDNWSVEELEMTKFDLNNYRLVELSRKSPHLKRLTLVNSYFVDDVGIKKISASWDRLEHLNISNYKITGESLARLGQRHNLRLLDIENCEEIDSADGFWLLVVKRLQLGISTPLRIKVGRDHEVFAIEMINLLKEQLKTVGVTLIE